MKNFKPIEGFEDYLISRSGGGYLEGLTFTKNIKICQQGT